jgi:aerobic C4-dicarboxylate transport protein
MTVTAPAAEAAQDRPRRRLYTQLWLWVLVAIAAGIVFGLVAPDTAKKAKWMADAFIQLIKTVTAPVIFVTVVIGIASLGNLARAGGLALRALFYFLCATVVALTLGLLAANIVKPGGGFEGQVSDTARASAKESIAEAGKESGVVPFITDHLLPTSFVQPFVDNEILQVLVLALLTAAAISMVAADQRERIVGVFESVSRVIFGVIRLIMWAAPIGAFGGMAFTVAQFGSASLTSLVLLMVTFWGTCAIFVFGVLGLVARLSGFSILRLIRLIRDELLIILGTSSSETVLPRLLAKLEAAGASRQTVGVVIPTGYSFNLDGTCIYLTLGAMFIVQASGQDMSIGQQIALAALMVLTSKGAAGITGAGLVTLTASLQAFGGQFFSAESIAVGIALVVGIDRIMSEGRALTNAIGNSVATLVIAGWQGERDDRRLQAVLAEPSIVDREVELALRGSGGGRGGTPEDGAQDGGQDTPRFERDPATGAHVAVAGEPRPGDR